MQYVIGLLAVFSALMLGAYLTNPFSRYSIVRRTYRAEMKNNVLTAINENDRLVLRQAKAWQIFAVIKNCIHILNSRWHKSPGSSGTTVREIMQDIYDIRFDPSKLLLTSGDHFSALFVRNLGVFYYPTLDTNLTASPPRWHDRQIVYLQTLSYALGVFAKQSTLTTTIVPTGGRSATCVNFYAYPSDTLYGMLYALAALLGKESARPALYGSPCNVLDTIPAAKQLHSTYRAMLTEHYRRYRTTVYDESTGIIRTDLHMSGAKDITKRTCAFYDNVIFWKTTELAMKLDLIPTDKQALKDLRARILETFWLKDKGYFLEDLSDESIRNSYYSSDWLIVLATGFLSPEKISERHYFEQSIKYIQANKIDQPFAIKYQHDTRAHRQFLAVRLAVASYGGDSIWSFWGMEYIKVLLLLYRATNRDDYLTKADYHIAAYQKNMLRDRGFPEVYDADGNLLQTPLYRSIRQTGWVIGFDQVLAMQASLKNTA